MDWKACIGKKIAKEVNPDIPLIRSLIKSSKNKRDSSNQLNLTEITAGSKISLMYDSLREVLEALALEKGYKIYNHECYTYFIIEILNISDLGHEFDEARKTRNAINYYGKEISIEGATQLLDSLEKLRSKFIVDLKQNYTR